MNEVLTAEMKIVTPVFCAGADQNGAPAQIRTFSIRGALRWWYRAMDGAYAAREQEFFGGTGSTPRSSPVAVQIRPWTQEKTPYRKELIPTKAPSSGAAYLGYTLYLSQNDRHAVAPGKCVEIRLRLAHPEVDDDARRAWAACLWLFGHLGGLGTRSRRGFGTMALTGWSGWEECNELPPAHGAPTPKEWKDRLTAGFGRIRQWFQPPQNASHQHLGASLRVFLWKEGYSDWLQALDEAGGRFRDFRAQEQIHKPELLAAFGMPIRFRHHQARLVRPVGGQRAASRLQFRVIPIGDRFHPLVWCAEGPLLPGLQAGSRLEYAGRYNQPYAGDRAQDDFLRSIQPFCVP